MNKKDEVERIFDHAKFQALALICAEPEPIPPVKDPLADEWLTEEELMRYWKLTSSSGLRSWRKRPLDQHPLPYTKVGDLIRFNRKEIDQWAREETAREQTTGKLQTKRRGLSVAPPQGGSHGRL